MPELPEIEAIKRVIEPQIKGFAVARITVNRPEAVACPSADEFCTRITGQFFTEIDRRGKFLILCLSSGDKVVLRLRMTGCLLVTPADYPEEKHIPLSICEKYCTLLQSSRHFYTRERISSKGGEAPLARRLSA